MDMKMNKKHNPSLSCYSFFLKLADIPKRRS
jgi:hypothetical protein